MALQFEDSNLEIHRFVVGPLENNVYVLRSKRTGEALLIDAADEPEVLLEACTSLGVKKVLETHGHHDHIQAVPALREAGYEVYVGEKDAAMLPGYDHLIDDGEVFEVGDVRLVAIHTPGHTPGSICYRVEGAPVLFSGDTLFPGGPGATRFPGGDFAKIIDSITNRLFSLDPKTVVLPGHGSQTTIGTELPHLDEWIARGW